MVQNKKTSSKIQQFLSGKGFYIALAFCLLAVGASAYTAVRLDSSPQAEAPYVADGQNEPDVNWGDQQANVPATEVPDTREPATQEPTTQARTEPDTTQKQVHNESYSLPLGSEISMDYSNGEMIYSKTMNDWRVHTGIDFKGEAGAAVKAIGSGTVRSVTNDALYGITVEIDHGDGVVARYCGLAQNPNVSEGKQVRTGDQLGLLGSVPCEVSEESHLHFEVRVDGTLADPLEILGKAG